MEYLFSMAIGVFDSGVGGLSIAQKIRECLPHEDLLYVADSAHAPYGEKSQHAIHQRCRLIIEFLLAKKVKLIVIACNTATVSAIKELRQEFTVPIVGVEPGVKMAIENRMVKVGVLATTQTIKSPLFNDLLARHEGHIKVELQACPGWVEQVEALQLNNSKTQALINQYVNPLLEKGVDKIVLGCTHYAFLAQLIKNLAGDNIEVINTATPVALEVMRRLDTERLISKSTTLGSEMFFSSGDLKLASRQIKALWGEVRIAAPIIRGPKVEALDI